MSYWKWGLLGAGALIAIPVTLNVIGVIGTVATALTWSSVNGLYD